jgi:hypothetical protein
MFEVIEIGEVGSEIVTELVAVHPLESVAVTV